MKNQTRLSLFSGSKSTKEFQTAVSLHCHTRHSRESMAFVPHYALRIPIVAGQFRKWIKRYQEMHGEEAKFSYE